VKRDKIVLVSVAAVCATLLVAALLMRGGGRAARSAQAGVAAGGEGADTPAPAGSGATGTPAAPEATAPAPATPTPQETPSFTSEQNRREVTLFFEEMNSESLGPEKRKIFLTSSIADQAKQIVVELINGPQEKGLLPTLPPQTRLRGLYLDRSGTVYIDFSGELVDLHPGGTDEEIATIFSIVDSLAYNLPQVKRVHVLVNGEERETLKSHLDLRRDYSKDMSIVDMDRKSAP